MPSDAPVTTNEEHDTPRHAEVSPTDLVVIRAKGKGGSGMGLEKREFRQSLTCPCALLCSKLPKLLQLWIKDGR